MSEFHVEVARIRSVHKHPNADTLSIAEVNGYPVIFRTGDFVEGRLAVHVPIDSIVPDLPEWSFLAGHRRIKAKRLRGVFSMGLLAHTQEGWSEGQNVQAELGIEKWEPGVQGFHATNTDDEPDPGFLPVFTDIEGYRRHKNVLQDGEEVVLTEKIHGANARFLFRDGRLWVGSHKRIKKQDDRNMWWQVSTATGLEDRLRKIPNIAVYGEIYGLVQDLHYGIAGTQLVLFDALDTIVMKYLDYDAFREVAAEINLPTVPELYRGPWSSSLLELAEGKTVLGSDHVREGFVVRPVQERWEHSVGRVILKMVGEGYLLRKAA
jgi:RNA ligase (TIGR02306 family)